MTPGDLAIVAGGAVAFVWTAVNVLLWMARTEKRLGQLEKCDHKPGEESE